MDNLLSTLFTSPFAPTIVAALFAVWYYRIRRRSSPHHGARKWALLIPVVAWAFLAIWDWTVTLVSPTANIRVDLLLLIPLVLLASIIGPILAVRK